MKVSISEDELWPCMYVNTSEGYCNVDISEEIYERYTKVNEEWFALQDIFKKLHSVECDRMDNVSS